MFTKLFDALVYLIVLVAIAHSLFPRAGKRAAMLTGPGIAARLSRDQRKTGP